MAKLVDKYWSEECNWIEYGGGVFLCATRWKIPPAHKNFLKSPRVCFEDGVYKISVSSKDGAGNTPESAGATFFVDSTKAEITSIVGLEEDIINAQEVNVKYTVFDTMGLKSIKVYVNGSVVSEITDFSADANNYSGSFTVTEDSSAQTVQIVVEDMAGNITDTNAGDFAPAYEFNSTVTISTNIFVRWYANTGLFWGSIAGIVALIAVVVFIISKKKKTAVK